MKRSEWLLQWVIPIKSGARKKNWWSNIMGIQTTHWCTWGEKSRLSVPITQESYFSSDYRKKLMLAIIESCQNTQCITIWGCVAIDQSECPGWPLSTTKSIYNGHESVRTGPRSNGRRLPVLVNHLLDQLDGRCVCHLPGESMAAGCTGKKADGGSVLHWTVFCCKRWVLKFRWMLLWHVPPT